MYPAASDDGLPRQLLAGPVVTPPRDQSGDRRYLKPEMIDEVFGYHPPSSETVGHVHTLIRAELRRMAHWLNDLLPEGPLKTTAINGLRDTMWAANAAVAVGQTPDWAEHAGRHVHFYNGEVVASFEAEQREVTKLGQWFLRYGSAMLQQGSAVDNAIRLLGEYNDLLSSSETAQEAATLTGQVWQPAPQRSGITDSEAATAVFEALGEASMCWDPPPAGVFDSTHATSVGERLLRRLGYQVPEKRQAAVRPSSSRAVSDEEAAEAVFQALGQAGLAWDQIPGAYRAEIAAAVGRDLLPRLGHAVPERYLGVSGRDEVAQLIFNGEPLTYDRLTTLTHRAYAAYGDSVNWQNYQGLPMPQWPDLGGKIQHAWLTAVGSAIEMYRAMVRLQIADPAEAVMPVQGDPPRFALGVVTPELEAGERDGEEYLADVAPPEVAERIDAFLEHPETGARPERTES